MAKAPTVTFSYHLIGDPALGDARWAIQCLSDGRWWNGRARRWWKRKVWNFRPPQKREVC